MTILITNLEDCLEDMTDDEMQQLSGGISISFDVYPSSATKTPRNRRTGTLLQDVSVGAVGAAYAQAFSRIAQDPTTRRILQRIVDNTRSGNRSGHFIEN